MGVIDPNLQKTGPEIARVKEMATEVPPVSNPVSGKTVIFSGSILTVMMTEFTDLS